MNHDELKFKKILIVDDSRTAIRIIKSCCCCSNNITFYDSTNVQDAMKILYIEKMGLIMTDLNMPEIDGNEFIDWIRNKYYDKKTPILVISSQDKNHINPNLINDDRLYYMKKPITKDNLCEIVLKINSSVYSNGTYK